MPDRDPELSPLCDADPLARALAKLRPAPAAVDPARVAVLAGPASRAADAAVWKRAFAAQCAVTGGLAAALTWFLIASTDPAETAVSLPPPPPRAVPSVPEVVPAPRPAPEPYPEPTELAAEPAPATNAEELADYFRVRREVLAAGLGLLPESSARPLPPVNPAELEKSLQLPPGVLASPFAAPPRPKAPPEPDPDSPE